MLLAAMMMTTGAQAAAPVLSGEVLASTTLSEDAPQLGTGIGVNLGLPLDAAAVTLTPEVGITAWSTDRLIVPNAGARVTIGKVIEPGAYAHVLFPLGLEERRFGWDAGGSLDFTAIPVLDIGLQAGLVSLGDAPALAGGLRLGLNF